MDNVLHLINRSTTTLSNSLLCNILLFGDNQFNDITNMLISESTVDFCKKKQKLGDSSVFLRCLMAIRDFGNSSFNFTSFFLLSLDTFLDTSCCCCLILEILWLLPNTHSVTAVTSWALNVTDIRFSMLAQLTLLFRGSKFVEFRDMTTPITCCHHVTL